MADEENIFDPMMKKKKKVKKPLDLSVLENSEEPQDKGEAVKDADSVATGEPADDLNAFALMKKKKKKKGAFNLDDLENALPDEKDSAKPEAENGRMISPSEGQTAGDVEAELGDDFDFTKKKKKKKKAVNFEDLPAEADEVDGSAANDDVTPSDADAASSVLMSDTSSTWLGSDRDYTYDELLQLVFTIIKEKNPDLDAGTKKRLVMRPPQVLRVGTKKTSFANFLEICRSLHRLPKHMQAFLLAELGTSGSVDANNQLIIKGRFQQKQIESVLRRYIKEYVACQTCKSPDTILQKETRLFFLQCETCGSRRSVASIKSGFQAVTGKRAAIRAKTA